MGNFNIFIEKQFRVSLLFFFLGLFFGILYSVNLLGVFIDSTTLNPVNIRSLHISLMLYGFIPLMLSYLPFLLKPIYYLLVYLSNIYDFFTAFWKYKRSSFL